MAMDDEPTMVRPTDPEESTRAVDRAAELATDRPTPRTAGPVGSGDRVAIVPGAVPEAPVYGVRRDAPPTGAAPRARAAAPTPRQPPRSPRPRSSAFGPLLVIAFGALIVAAAVVLVILVTA